jgi:hypothetical protein
VLNCGKGTSSSCLIRADERCAASAVRFLPLRIVDGADTITAKGDDEVGAGAEKTHEGGSEDIEVFCVLRRVRGAGGESVLSKEAATASVSRAGAKIRAFFDRRLVFVLNAQEDRDSGEATFTAESGTTVATVRERILRTEELLAAGRAF